MQAPRQGYMQALRYCSRRAQQRRQQELSRPGLHRQRSRHCCPLAPSRSHRPLSCRRSRQTCAASGWRRSALLPALLLLQRRTGRAPHSWLRWAWRRQGQTWRPASMAARHPAAEPCGHGRRRWRLRCSAASSRAAEPGNGQGSWQPGSEEASPKFHVGVFPALQSAALGLLPGQHTCSCASLFTANRCRPVAVPIQHRWPACKSRYSKSRPCRAEGRLPASPGAPEQT